MTACAAVSRKPRRVGDEEGLHISVRPLLKGRAMVQATGVLDHPTLGQASHIKV
jgi:hypothetical protein